MRNLEVKMSGPLLASLFRIIGRRVFLTFCLVSFLVVFLLAAVNVTSRHAMQRYVDDQVKRVPLCDLCLVIRLQQRHGTEKGFDN